jgi:hypothetical protein
MATPKEINHRLVANIRDEPEQMLKPISGYDREPLVSIEEEWDERENSLYIVLNQTLRLADRMKLRPWFKYLKLFLTGFFKLP